MAGTGDITIDGVKITPEGFDRLAAEVTERLKTTSKDPGQYEVVDSLQGIMSLPMFHKNGSTYKLVMVLAEALRGLDGKSVYLQKSGEYLQWRQGNDSLWVNLIALSELKGASGDSIVLRKGSTAIEWKKSNEADTAYQVLVNLSAITGDSIVLRKGSAAIEWKKSSEADTAYKTLVALSDLKGVTGDSIVLRKGSAAIEWKKSSEADASYKTLVALSELKGATGDNIVLRKGSTNIEWKLSSEADTLYKALIAISELKGNTGENIVLRKGSAAIEWKLSSEADTAYRTLVNLADLKGQKGDSGKNFAIEGYYNTLAILQGAVPNPVAGATYGVGISAPYQLYIYDAVQKRWVNNGTIGQNGAGSGNVYADPSGLMAGKKYLFVPGTDNSTTGTYKELSLADFIPDGYELLFVKKEV